ncbi:uncharacterized protein PRCAT00001114001 [Priceomyces carsonii]|uniref:uncharacterized protein n=1 Tax=Priceomyces carsonii TaxID=28549 RepID=UPI002ED7FDB9|nr:unnamed protein product [Priceomyces carsonii]
MSSSPTVCVSPGFTFPSTNMGSPAEDYFSVKESKKDDKRMEGGLRLRRHHLGMAAHKNSNSSDLTFCDESFLMQQIDRTDSTISTDTLVDDTNLNKRNTLNLKLSFAQNSQGLILSGKDLKSLSFKEDEDEIPKAASAIEPTFNFHTKNLSTSSAASFRSVDLNNTSLSERQSSFSGITPLEAMKYKNSLSTPTDINSTNFNQRTLKRLGSAPNINLRESILNLPLETRYLSLSEAEVLINNADILSDARDLLIIDIRPFADYMKSHIRSSINACLPLTLLKRSTYDLTKCINSLPIREREILSSFFKFNEVQSSFNENLSVSEHTRRVLIYDTLSSSSNIYYFCKKFLNTNLWDLKAPIYVLSSSLEALLDSSPKLFESGTEVFLNIKDKSSQYNFMNLKRPPPSYKSDIWCKSASATPTLSNFKLPDTPRMGFKIRHNEELIESSSVDKISTFKLNNLNSSSILPNWINSVLSDPMKLNEDFKLLEKSEKERLNNALSIDNISKISDVPLISSGIEYGYKNRYKDVLLYEHSRVKLNDANKKQLCDYIHASYIDPIESLPQLTEHSQTISGFLKYIATQGPLEQTMGDFWKCVINHMSPIIVSLADEFENGIKKCSPFWRSGSYVSNNNLIKVTLVIEEKVNPQMVFRVFDISMDNIVFHTVFQMHVVAWPDQGILDCDDLLRIIILKKYVLLEIKNLTLHYPTIIHCSAGCGRTGTFCAIDSIVNILMANDSIELTFDPVCETVNHFRKQRISMVENLRQYYLIYDMLLKYLNEKDNNIWNGLCKSSIVQKFIERLLDYSRYNLA